MDFLKNEFSLALSLKMIEIVIRRIKENSQQKEMFVVN